MSIRTVCIFFVLIVCITVGLAMVLRPTESNYDHPAPRTEGLTVDIDALNLMTATGELFKLENLSGNVVLINVFATWCGPCAEEIPKLKKLHKKFYDKGLRIVSISRKEEAKLIEDFVAAKQIPYTILLDPDGKGTEQFSADEDGVPMPTNMLLDRDLIPVYMDTGYSPEQFEMLRTEIRKCIE